MRKKHHWMPGAVIGIILALGLVGCGKKDELVLITTERSTETTESSLTALTDDSVEDASTEETVVTEEASEEDLAVTLEDIYAANSGDRILSGGQGCSVNTIYYAAGTEVYSEYRFLGFDENGNYLQAYEDSDGTVEVLDNYNQCWYMVSDHQICTRLYPEDGVNARLIDYNHNNTIMTLDGGEQLQSIYRENGRLVVELDYTDDSDEQFLYTYYLMDDLVVDEIYCYDSSGEQISHAWVTRGAVYNTPDEIQDIFTGQTNLRIINTVYPYGGGVDNIYQIPDCYPLELELIEYKAYEDEKCTIPWNEDNEDAGMEGAYGDETIYLQYGS